jgi:Exo-beta-D-glucosaminidase Ig-fold domain
MPAMKPACRNSTLDVQGNRVLPVLYSDNCITLLPHELRTVDIRCPDAGVHCARIQVRGWNVHPASVLISE